MSPPPRPARAPLRIAALAKQIPLAESFQLEDGLLVRRGVDTEMNAYCRRAVAEGVTLARDSGGSCTVFTLGPPSAEDVLREAVAWGADDGVHVCDPALAGSDTLATARALAAALRRALAAPSTLAAASASGEQRNDDIGEGGPGEGVIGVGAAVRPDEYGGLSLLVAVFQAWPQRAS